MMPLIDITPERPSYKKKLNYSANYTYITKKKFTQLPPPLINKESKIIPITKISKKLLHIPNNPLTIPQAERSPKKLLLKPPKSLMVEPDFIIILQLL